MIYRLAIGIAVGFFLVPDLAVAQPAPTPTPPAPARKIHSPGPPATPLYRDTAQYPPLHLTWNTNTSVGQALAVFPHPLLPQRAALATTTGLMLTDDAGNTWTALPAAAPDVVGTVRDVAFHPFSPDTFYVASDTRGVWVTTDDGKTFRQIGSKATGMASDTVVSLIVYPGDNTRQTLLAVHGDAAPGLSRSRDGGKTWDVVNPEYRFTRLLGAEGHQQQLYLIGSTLRNPDIECLYACGTVGEFIAEVMRDIAATDLACAPTPYQKPATLYLTTSDNGLYRIDDTDSAGLSFTNKQLPLKDVDGLASVVVTWGPNADAINLFVYDPAKLGLVLSNDDLATTQTESDGLPVSSLVKEGALSRANANGTVFYAVANLALSIGRSAHDVPTVAFTPCAFDINPLDTVEGRKLTGAFTAFSSYKGATLDAARALVQSVGDLEDFYHRHQLVITARVPLQPSPPTSVTVDLSRFGGLPNTPLFDDGKHNDGAAGDGTYGGAFAFFPGDHRPRNNQMEWRSSWPGRVAMGVTANYADGHRQGAVGVVDIFTQIADITMWLDGVKSIKSTAEGGATAEPFQEAPQAGHPPDRRDVAVRLNVPKGPWSVHFKVGNKPDIASHAAMSFYLRLDSGTAPTELYLQLRDNPEFSEPTTTERVPMLNGAGLIGEYRRIIIPMSQMLGSASTFQSDHLGEIIISGDTDAPATLVMKGLQAVATAPPPVTPASAPSPTQ